MVIPELRLQGRVELGRQRTYYVERVVQGPFVLVPGALVCHAHNGMFELGHGGTWVVTVTMGVGNVRAHCQ